MSSPPPSADELDNTAADLQLKFKSAPSFQHTKMKTISTSLRLSDQIRTQLQGVMDTRRLDWEPYGNNVSD